MKTTGTGAYSISSDYLILLTELAFERGISAAELLIDSGLPEQILFQPGVPVGHESCLSVIERFCNLTNDLGIALEYGKRMTLSKHGALGYAAQYSATMGDAALKVMRYVETRAQIFEIARASSEHQRHLTITPRFDNPVAGPFITLAFLSSVETICRTLVGNYGREAESCIHLTCPSSLTGQNTLPFFNPELETLAEQQLQTALTSLTQSGSVSGKVREILNDRLQDMPTVEHVASMLCMSAATLNRKLKADSSSFQQLKDDVRYRHAQRLLKQEDLAIDLIAEQLGYSDASNFAKAFKAWSGVSPSQYRQSA